jgi:hypothetical protein
VRQADVALCEIQKLLATLEGRVEQMIRMRRWPPQALAALRAEIDSSLTAIDRVLRGAGIAGQSLLSSDVCSAGGEPVTGGGASGGEYLAVGPSRADDGEVFAQSLRFKLPPIAGPADLQVFLTTIKDASVQISEHRERLSAFVTEQVIPLQAGLAVAGENIAASGLLAEDSSFAVAVSELTRADVLASVCNQPNRRPSQPTRTRPRVP